MQNKYIKAGAEAYFLSNAFGSRMANYFSYACKKIGRPLPYIMVCRETPQQPAARTDGRRMMVNLAAPSVASQSKKAGKFLFILGLLTHEFGHYRFTNFPTLKRVVDEAMHLSLYPAPDNTLKGKPEYVRFRDSLKSVRPAAFARVIQEFHNVLEDGYIEEACFRTLTGRLVDALAYVRDFQWAEIPSLGFYRDRMESSPEASFPAMHDILLQYSKWGKVKYDPDSEEDRQFLRQFAQVFSVVDRAQYEDDPIIRTSLYNEVIILIWEYISPGLESVEDYCGESWRPWDSGAAVGETSAVPPLDVEDGSLSGSRGARHRFASEIFCAPKGDGGDLDYSITPDEAIGRIENSLRISEREAAEEIRCGRQEMDDLEALNCILSRAGFTAPHIDMPMKVSRIYDITPDIKESAEALLAEQSTLVGQMVRRMSSVLPKDRFSDLGTYGYAGTRFDITRMVYRDCRMFKAPLSPTATAGLCVLLLIDESGSMKGERIEKTKEMCMVLHQTFLRLHIPCSIVGHSESAFTSECTVEFDIIASFNNADGMDTFRICSLSAKENNRDGAALSYAGQLLLERSEQVKLLIHVTDGAPLAKDYSGIKAMDDVKDILKGLARRGVTTFAAAIGADRDKTSGIYQGRCLNIDSLSDMSLELASLIRRYIPLI